MELLLILPNFLKDITNKIKFSTKEAFNDTLMNKQLN